nr:uncharacterized protein LOC105332608 isoform X3 [Crassostrea gigas]
MQGNIDGVRNQNDPDLQWCRKEERHECSQVLQAVQTRAQKKKENQGMKKLNVTSLVDADLTLDQMKQLQMEDASLNVYHKHAASGRKKTIGDYIETWFSVDRGLLYRHYHSTKVTNFIILKLLLT